MNAKELLDYIDDEIFAGTMLNIIKLKIEDAIALHDLQLLDNEVIETDCPHIVARWMEENRLVQGEIRNGKGNTIIQGKINRVGTKLVGILDEVNHKYDYAIYPIKLAEE
jgi:hypothetical protein